MTELPLALASQDTGPGIQALNLQVDMPKLQALDLQVSVPKLAVSYLLVDALGEHRGWLEGEGIVAYVVGAMEDPRNYTAAESDVRHNCVWVECCCQLVCRCSSYFLHNSLIQLLLPGTGFQLTLLLSPSCAPALIALPLFGPL